MRETARNACTAPLRPQMPTASGRAVMPTCQLAVMPALARRALEVGKLEAPPGFEPGMEVLQI